MEKIVTILHHGPEGAEAQSSGLVKGESPESVRHVHGKDQLGICLYGTVSLRMCVCVCVKDGERKRQLSLRQCSQ